MVGTGYYPFGREDAYQIEKDDKHLIGTAEVVLTSYFMNETLDDDKLPVCIAGISPCYRREAGSYGKDTKGLYRIHQFNKVEQVVFCKPEDSPKMHEFILNNAEEFLQSLKLPYRVMRLCTGDLGPGQVEKFDIETWMPSREGYGETHSASRFHDFQARRLNIRFKNNEGKTAFVHTLNNTVAATPRLLIPILEIYQQDDGSVLIPEVLQPYMHGMTCIQPKQSHI
jgi:seryl-tRNA synthetase